MNNDLRRRQISAMIEEIVALTKSLEKRGIQCRQSDDQEAQAILKRITERVYSE